MIFPWTMTEGILGQGNSTLLDSKTSEFGEQDSISGCLATIAEVDEMSLVEDESDDESL